MNKENKTAQAATQQLVLTRAQAGEFSKAWFCIFGASTGSAELCIRKIEAAVLSALRAPITIARATCPADVCQAAKADGVLCADSERNRANGVRPASAPVAGEAVAWRIMHPRSPKPGWQDAAHEKPPSPDKVKQQDPELVLELAYAPPQASETVRILFPTHLRKMWSGGEVQAWLDEHLGITPAKPSAKGSRSGIGNGRLSEMRPLERVSRPQQI